MAVQNWGVAILFLTLTIKLIFSLTQKSLFPPEMQLLQPQLNEIWEKYKDNQQVQFQKTMALFKTRNFSCKWLPPYPNSITCLVGTI